MGSSRSQKRRSRSHTALTFHLILKSIHLMEFEVVPIDWSARSLVERRERFKKKKKKIWSDTVMLISIEDRERGRSERKGTWRGTGHVDCNTFRKTRGGGGGGGGVGEGGGREREDLGSGSRRGVHLKRRGKQKQCWYPVGRWRHGKVTTAITSSFFFLPRPLLPFTLLYFVFYFILPIK